MFDCFYFSEELFNTLINDFRFINFLTCLLKKNLYMIFSQAVHLRDFTVRHALNLVPKIVRRLTVILNRGFVWVVWQVTQASRVTKVIKKKTALELN